MDTKDIKNITDVIELEYLQNVQDALGKITKITTAILDPNGIPLTNPSNLYAFCEMMQSRESGIKMCMRTNSQLIDINKTTKDVAIVTCPNSGLKTAAVPIFLDEKYLGSWLIGQIRTTDIDMALIEATSKEAGISISEAKDNISQLPIIDDEEFNNILDFMRIITEETTNLVKITEQLNTSAQIMREFIELSDVGVYVVDFETGELLMCNNEYAKLINHDFDSLPGMLCYNTLGFDDWCEFCPKDKLLDENGDILSEPYIWENYLEKQQVWLRITSRAIKWTNGKNAQMITFLDITKQKENEKRISYLAYYDQRFSIPNAMRLFDDISNGDLSSPSLICLDVKGLRRINEAYSRETGDMLLVEIKNWILSTGEFGDRFYRIDGDEFALLINTDVYDAYELTKQIWARCDTPWTVKINGIDQKIFANISMGVLPLESIDIASYSEMRNIIERILDIAKEKKRPIKYDSATAAEFSKQLLLEISLKECILNGMEGFSLCYQPIVDPYTGLWRGVEALCRWNSPDLGPITPDVFIPKVETLGLIGMLGNWVLEEAISQVKKWELEKHDHFVLDVNLSPIQLSDPELGNSVLRLLTKYDFSAKHLGLEITESEEIRFEDHVITSLANLRAMGIMLSLDDFGTGYSSFSSLNNLPIRVIKMDRSFIRDLEDSLSPKQSMRIVHIMIEYAHNTGMRVVAEGVETEYQANALKESHVDLIQGYFYSKPLPADELEQFLDKFNPQL